MSNIFIYFLESNPSENLCCICLLYDLLNLFCFLDPSMTVRCMYISSIYRFFAVRHYNIILMDGGVISHALTFFVFPTTDCCFLRIIDARGTSSIVATIEVTSYVHFSDF